MLEDFLRFILHVYQDVGWLSLLCQTVFNAFFKDELHYGTEFEIGSEQFWEQKYKSKLFLVFFFAIRVKPLGHWLAIHSEDDLEFRGFLKCFMNDILCYALFL